MKVFDVWLTTVHKVTIEAADEQDAKACMKSSHADNIRGCEDHELNAYEVVKEPATP